MENNLRFITLTDENGDEVTFEVIDTVMVEDKKYLIVSEKAMEENEALILYMEERKGEYYFTPVEDKKEFELVREAYEEFWEE